MKIMIITITGLPGSGKTSVAKELSRHLHIKHYSMGDLFRRLAHKKHKNFLKLMKEKEKIIDFLDKEQVIIAKNNKNAIIDSRLGAYLIKNAKYKIYLHASLKKRAQRLVSRDKENYKEAVKEILSREKFEISHYKKRYNVDYRNKKLYNLIINTENLKVNDCAKKILSKINSS